MSLHRDARQDANETMLLRLKSLRVLDLLQASDSPFRFAADSFCPDPIASSDGDLWERDESVNYDAKPKSEMPATLAVPSLPSDLIELRVERHRPSCGADSKDETSSSAWLKSVSAPVIDVFVSFASLSVQWNPETVVALQFFLSPQNAAGGPQPRR